MIELVLWQKVGLYILLLISIFIYVKSSNIKINGVPLLRARYRLLLSIFFPLIIVGAVLIGSLLLAIAMVIVSLISIYSLITKKKISFSIKRIKTGKPLH